MTALKRQRYSHIPSHPRRRATQLPLYQRVHAARQGRIFFFVCRSVYRSPTHPCHDHAAYIRARSLLAHYFFLAHYACRSSHQISRELGEWNEMWGGGFSHSCTCVCTRNSRLHTLVQVHYCYDMGFHEKKLSKDATGSVCHPIRSAIFLRGSKNDLLNCMS